MQALVSTKSINLSVTVVAADRTIIAQAIIIQYDAILLSQGIWQIEG